MVSGQAHMKPVQKQTARTEQHTMLRLRTDMRAGKGWCNDCINSCVINKGCSGNWVDKIECYNNCKNDYCSTFCPS